VRGYTRSLYRTIKTHWRLVASSETVNRTLFLRRVVLRPFAWQGKYDVGGAKFNAFRETVAAASNDRAGVDYTH